MNQISVSIIFVCYNSKDLGLAIINSVFEKTKDINFEIIVVDNDSHDGSVEAMRNVFGEKIKIIESGQNLGWEKGCNLGMQNANGKYIMLFNMDMLLINNVVKILYDFMETNPRAGACGGNLYDTDGKPTYSYSINFLQDKESSLINVFKSIKKKITGKIPEAFNYTDKIKKVDCVNGAIMMLRKEALDKSGLFDKDFFLYQAEPELMNRITKCGYLCYNIPQAKANHFESKTFGGNLEKRFARYCFGSYLYYEKVHGKESVKRHFKERMRFTNIINILSFGLYAKECSMRKRVLKQEFDRWQNERG